jgi:o-succinylbenzoate---CoA ligase
MPSWDLEDRTICTRVLKSTLDLIAAAKAEAHLSPEERHGHRHTVGDQLPECGPARPRRGDAKHLLPGQLSNTLDDLSSSRHFPSRVRSHPKPKRQAIAADRVRLMVVEGWLARAVTTRPDHTAVETPTGSWSYRELNDAARSGAASLARHGAGPGARIGIELPGGLPFAQALHACLLLGAVALPLDLRLSAEERAQIAAGCDLVVREPLGKWSAAELPRIAGTAHELESPALIIHTSGTTSAPRPVELTYGNLLWSALGSAVALGRDPEERWLCALPLSHVGGLSILMRSTIYATTAVLHERFETDRALHSLMHEDITLVSLVATTLSRLLDAGLSHPPRLRCALTGGGPVPPALIARARRAGVPVSLTYGLTESCSQATTTPLPEAAPAISLAGGEEGAEGADGEIDASAGPPLFCTRLRIAPDGEILLAGPTVAPGAPQEDGWLHTGDLGSLDARGHLHVTGRKADTIVSGGENVAPAEVEAVLEAHPLVLEAAVIGRPDPEWGEAVTAIVLPRPGAVLEEAELRAHCLAALARYKVPKDFTLTEEPLPRTRSGKLLRRELPRSQP